MVDCSIYQQIEETENQKLFRKFLERFKTDKNGHIYMDLYIDGKLIEGADLNYGATIDDFINPSTKLYRSVSTINKMYIEARGASDKASSSSHYNNNLLIYAHMRKCIVDERKCIVDERKCIVDEKEATRAEGLREMNEGR